jgi:hypothetical protein
VAKAVAVDQLQMRTQVRRPAVRRKVTWAIVVVKTGRSVKDMANVTVRA